MQSILIKDTTREQRIQIVNKALNVCGSECEFRRGGNILGGGLTDTCYQPYIDGEKEISELNAKYRANYVH